MAGRVVVMVTSRLGWSSHGWCSHGDGITTFWRLAMTGVASAFGLVCSSMVMVMITIMYGHIPRW